MRELADDYELLFIDDDSQDGSEEICAELSERFPARIVVRKGERGLATAVIHGITGGVLWGHRRRDGRRPLPIRRARSHAWSSGCNREESDFVLGSRYVEGGSIHEGLELLPPAQLDHPPRSSRDRSALS